MPTLLDLGLELWRLQDSPDKVVITPNTKHQPCGCKMLDLSSFPGGCQIDNAVIGCSRLHQADPTTTASSSGGLPMSSHPSRPFS
jgi:hypothetical protein